ncbi:MAG: conjugal transfer protein TraX [Clostridiales bacterium]|nr:conjugal transfer protein TraX [Clostridiales bacterium]
MMNDSRLQQTPCAEGCAAAGEESRRVKGLNRDIIKYIAMFTMLLNHIAHVFPLPGTFLRELFIDLGYFTAPVMCYFLVEGYHYTHSKKQYGIRLAVFALLSELPFCLAFTYNGLISFQGMNMIFTLLLCFLIVLAMDQIWNPILRKLVVFALIAASVCSDWAIFAPVFTILFVRAGQEKEKIRKAYVIATLAFGLANFSSGVGYCPPQRNLLLSLGTMVGPALAGFVIVELYNGKRMERGRTFSQWFFYLFYPVHLLILGLLRVYCL